MSGGERLFSQLSVREFYCKGKTVVCYFYFLQDHRRFWIRYIMQEYVNVLSNLILQKSILFPHFLIVSAFLYFQKIWNVAYNIYAWIQKTEICLLHICSEIYLQLLKCLFGTNLSAQLVEPDDSQRTSSSLNCTSSAQGYDGFYTACFQTPYRHLRDFITYSSSKAQDKDEEFV